MKTCGECIHWLPVRGSARGQCNCDAPTWVWLNIENIAGESACTSDDTQAEHCDTFSARPNNANGCVL